MKRNNSYEIIVYMELSNLEHPKVVRDKMGQTIMNLKASPPMIKEYFIKFNSEVREDLIHFLKNPESNKNEIYIDANVLKVTKESVKLQFACVLLPTTLLKTRLE